SPRAELETRAESWQRSLSEPKACRWELLFSHARSRGQTRFIVMHSSTVKLSRLLSLADSPEDSLAESRTACSTSSTKKIESACGTHFNVPSCGTYRFQPRRQGDPNCFLSGRDRAPTYRAVPMFG